MTLYRKGSREDSDGERLRHRQTRAANLAQRISELVGVGLTTRRTTLSDGTRIKTWTAKDAFGRVRRYSRAYLYEEDEVIESTEILALEHGYRNTAGNLLVGDWLTAYALSGGTVLGSWTGHVWGQSSTGTLACALGMYPEWTGAPDVAVPGDGYASVATEAQQAAYWDTLGWYRDPANHTGLLRAVAQVWGPLKNLNNLGGSTLDPGAWAVVRWVDDTETPHVLRYALIHAQTSFGVVALPLEYGAEQQCYASILAAELEGADAHTAETCRLTESSVLMSLSIPEGATPTELISGTAYDEQVPGSPLCFGWAWAPMQWKTPSESMLTAVQWAFEPSGTPTICEVVEHTLTITASGATLSAGIQSSAPESWVGYRGPTQLIQTPSANAIKPVEYCDYLSQFDGTPGLCTIFGWIDEDGNIQRVTSYPNDANGSGYSLPDEPHISICEENWTRREGTEYGAVIQGGFVVGSVDLTADIPIEINSETTSSASVTGGATETDTYTSQGRAWTFGGYIYNPRWDGHGDPTWQAGPSERCDRMEEPVLGPNGEDGWSSVTYGHWSGKKTSVTGRVSGSGGWLLRITGPDSVLVARMTSDGTGGTRTTYLPRTDYDVPLSVQNGRDLGSRLDVYDYTKGFAGGTYAGWDGYGFNTFLHWVFDSTVDNADTSYTVDAYRVIGREKYQIESGSTDEGNYLYWRGLATPDLVDPCRNILEARAIVSAGGDHAYSTDPDGVAGTVQETSGSGTGTVRGRYSGAS